MPFLPTGYEVYQGEEKLFPMSSALNRLFRTLEISTFFLTGRKYGFKYPLIGENEIKVIMQKVTVKRVRF